MSRSVLFNALDTNSVDGLWATNGTVSGTHEITGIANTGPQGIDPLYITPFNGTALFNGTDTSNQFQLWTTNGTAAGTHELTGISGASASGLDPRYMHVYNNEVLFRGNSGVPGNYIPNLWVSDGTAAGTHLLSGIANAFSGGLLGDDPDFTNFGGRVLFRGRDAANNVGLWTTDGTAAGTFELAPISGAFVVGSPGSDVQPRYMAVLGNHVLFDGADQEDTPGSLWITDGTAGGTFEIGGQGNAGIAGSPNGDANQLPHGIQPRFLTTFNGKVLFAGQDNTLKPNLFYADTDALWISDGTAGGTVEVGGAGNAGIAGANSAQNGGIFWNQSVEFPDFTVYNNMVLFVGRDASNHIGLWRTDGTAGGTFEIGGQNNTGITGGLGFSGSESPNFHVYNGRVLFEGFDSLNAATLWVTDGTAGGTHELTGIAGAAGNFTPTGFATLPTSPRDLTADGVSDVVWRNAGNGDTGYWGISNYVATWHDFGITSTAYSVVGTGDFNADGTSDILWRNNANGDTGYWGINNNVATWHDFGITSTAFSVVGTGDLNADGRSDVLWRNNANGDTGYWALGSNSSATWHDFGITNPSFSVVGVGDFNDDGFSDVLWHNNSSGDTGYWALGSNSSATWHDLGTASTAYSVAGVGDLNGDGTSDILWRNNSNGDTGYWSVNGDSRLWYDFGITDSSYSVAGVGDYNGDNTSDVLWRNNSTGDTGVWLVSDNFGTWHDFGVTSTAYSVQNV
jgi:ELWxxDGT repeat protein